MRTFIRKHLKTLLFFAIIGAIGGYFTGLFVLDGYPAEIREQVLADAGSVEVLGAVTAAQSAGYGLILGAIGILIAEKIGLWRNERKLKIRPLLWTAAVAVVSGLAIILLDLFYFSNANQAIADSYAVKPTLTYILASVLYGGVIEEVMLRLFWMSLAALVLHKIFERKTDGVSTWVLIAANVISALLFAAGHLPATFMMIGNSPMIIARCFIMNGGAGLMFGWLYRKYGLRYSMLAHAGCHVVMKLVWVLAI